MNTPFAGLHGDALSVLVALLLLAMSVGSWVVILYKGWLLHRASQDHARAKPAFWQAANLDDGLVRVRALERVALLTPLVEALSDPLSGTLAGQSTHEAQRTRVLRDALHRVVHRLQSGQILLATVGATAPFVGLLGTVWGIYHALTGIATAGQLSIEQVAGPVGEALIMTAAGLGVALPAVLAYNVMGRVIHRLELELEGFARDLMAL